MLYQLVFSLAMLVIGVGSGWLIHAIVHRVKEFKTLINSLIELSESYQREVNVNKKLFVQMSDTMEDCKTILGGIQKMCEVQAENVLKAKAVIDTFEKPPVDDSPALELMRKSQEYYAHQYTKELLDQGVDPDEAKHRAAQAFHDDLEFNGIPTYAGGE